jgi:hypothetical protein
MENLHFFLYERSSYVYKIMDSTLIQELKSMREKLWKRTQIFLLCILMFLILDCVNVTHSYLTIFSQVKAADPTGWLIGWSYRKSHVINPASGAGKNYQVKINAWYDKKQLIPNSAILSTLPVPPGTSIQSAQAAKYWDGTYLHVWYGAKTSGDETTDDIYYTKSSDLQNWAAPVKVIDRPSGEGIRDPAEIMVGNTIYFLCQCCDGAKYFIRLYKISKTADFTNPDNYIHVGIALDVGGSGSYDELMAASPTPVKIGPTIWILYEALSTNAYSIGRAYTSESNIESLPYTKDGQLRDTQGNVIYSPEGQAYEICPNNFLDTNTVVVNHGSPIKLRYITGDIPNNSMTMASSDVAPHDNYENHDCFSLVDVLGYRHFLLMSWTSGSHYLRMYRLNADCVILDSKCKTDFGDVRFTDDDGTTLLDYWMEEFEYGEYSEYSGNPIQSYTNDGMDWPICVLKDGDYFYKYYSKPYSIPRDIYRAKSSDGKTGWTDDPSTPVLQRKVGTKYDSAVTCPNVWKEDGTYKMLFSGLYGADGKWRTFYATSSDGVNWTVQNNDEPVLEPTEPWEYHCEPWGVIKVGNTYYLWYNNIGSYGNRATGLATSTDCIHWTKDSNNPIFTNGRFMTNVVKNGSYYYLFIFHYYTTGKSCIELYRDTSPTFYPSSRKFIQVVKYPVDGSSWEANILDGITVLTDDITKSSFDVTNGQLWIYYGANTGTTKGHGLLIEPSLSALNGKFSSATFWVEVADDLSTNPATIYIYYGKSDASTTSNGAGTFIYFNHFDSSEDFTEEDGTWSLDASNSIYKYVSGGTMQVQSWKDVGRSSNDGYRLRFRHKSSAQFDSGAFSRYESGYTYGGIYVGKGSAGTQDVGGYAENIWTYLYLATSSMGTDWHISEALNFRQKYVAFTDEVQRYDGNVNFHLTSTKIALAAWANGAAEFDWVFVAKYVNPEPTHRSWGDEETLSEYVIIDQAFVSDERADIGSVQTVGFHAKWSNNGSDIAGGSIYINNTEYLTNESGWINFNTYSLTVGAKKWTVTGVNCNGVTSYMERAPDPTIIWDQIKIIDGGITKKSITIGETTTIWFKASYEYGNHPFDDTHGALYVNEMPMLWSATNNRWEYTYQADTPGSIAFSVSKVTDNTYNLTTINDTVGTQIIEVLSSPFTIISNSTITELAFNSTSKTLTFKVSGPKGTIGYTNVTVAKTLIQDIDGLQIYLDENLIDYTVTPTEYYWLIHFTYTHSTHKVLIILSQTNANSTNTHSCGTVITFSSITILVIATILLAYKKIRRK